jgi:cephalosporin hydroxylase
MKRLAASRQWLAASPARRLWRRLKTGLHHRLATLQRRYLMSSWLRHHQRLLFSPTEPVRWMGVPVLKNPLDCWIYQEILMEVQPQVIIELGSYTGGSTLFFCHMLDLIGGEGVVVSIDINRDLFQAAHPRMILITGDCADPAVQAQVASMCHNRRCLVVHDADHHQDAVLRDLRAYSPFVSEGSYFIVEDGIVDLVELPGWGKQAGPLPAIQMFLAATDDFIVDIKRERYLLTYNPSGFLKRVRRTDVSSNSFAVVDGQPPE